MARSLCRTVESIATHCSVKAKVPFVLRLNLKSQIVISS
jgi:hypothetical protein